MSILISWDVFTVLSVSTFVVVTIVFEVVVKDVCVEVVVNNDDVNLEDFCSKILKHFSVEFSVSLEMSARIAASFWLTTDVLQTPAVELLSLLCFPVFLLFRGRSLAISWPFGVSVHVFCWRKDKQQGHMVGMLGTKVFTDSINSTGFTKSYRKPWDKKIHYWLSPGPHLKANLPKMSPLYILV